MDRPPVNVENLLAYCSSLASEFEARRNRVRHFVQHNLTSGTANEAILRDFLASISARTWGITDGFICNPIRGDIKQTVRYSRLRSAMPPGLFREWRHNH